jgi:NADH-quinone oxidoreductase subunit M
MNTAVALLSFIIFLPALAAIVVAFLPKDKPEAAKLFTLFITLLVFGVTLWVAIPREPGSDSLHFAIGQPDMQFSVGLPWIEAFRIEYLLGLDGISFPLVLLTAFITLLSMWTSWNITKYVKAYCVLFLLLETGMLGVFIALDFFLFYVFWEVMLLPMYFLIGVWGGPRREYAAIKFFLYTLLGSVFMLIAILMLYFSSDLRQLATEKNVALFAAAHPHLSNDASTDAEGKPVDSPLMQKFKEVQASEYPWHTFNILALQQIGQHTNDADWLERLRAGGYDGDKHPFDEAVFLGKSIQWWSFVLLFIGFAIKVPSVPLHTWLPDAHVEAPTPISMILAGVLLKMGGYGILRICYPICPAAGYELAWYVCGVGVVSMVYGAFAALAQRDFKRLVAYSSVSHMGYVILGIGVWSATQANGFNPYYWEQGVSGAMFQMIAHGISSPGMFFLVGVVYDRVHHRNLDEFGGLFARMPVYSGLAIVIFFAGLGLPGLCGFIGEVLVTLSAWNFSKVLAVISAGVVILTAAYILWTIQRVYLGPEYKGPHGDHLTPMTSRELAIVAPLVVMSIVLGVYPPAMLDYLKPSVDKTVVELATWTKDVQPYIGLDEEQMEEAQEEEKAKTAALVP